MTAPVSQLHPGLRHDSPALRAATLAEARAFVTDPALYLPRPERRTIAWAVLCGQRGTRFDWTRVKAERARIERRNAAPQVQG